MRKLRCNKVPQTYFLPRSSTCSASDAFLGEVGGDLGPRFLDGQKQLTLLFLRNGRHGEVARIEGVHGSAVGAHGQDLSR